MTQTIVQGSEDPLLVLDHQGGSGNPSIEIQQDETAVAFIFWNQALQTFNMGPASAGLPSLSIRSDGTVMMEFGMRDLKAINIRVTNAMEVDGAITTGGITTNQLLAGTARITDGLTVDTAITTGGITANELLAGSAKITGNIAIDSANITQLTANGLLAGPTMITGGVVIDSANITQLTVNGLVVQNGASLTNGLVVDNVNASGTITAGNYLTSSSREIKENVVDLGNKEALEALEHLSPVKFNLKADNAKKLHHGFVAEDVPGSVAGSDGKSINVMDIVAILTRVVKEQQKTIDALVAKSH
jgi:hypothetical protein